MIATALRALLWLMLMAAQPAFAQHDALFIEDLTWTELRDAIKGGKTTVIVPIGGTEQNGPHMVLGKHNARVRELSRRIAAALGNALVAPVMAYVPEGNIEPPTAHMKFPGTITMPDATFEKVLESSARSFRAHGFRDIVFLGDHGSYQKDMKAVADRLDREWAATPVRAHAVTEYYRVTEVEFPQWLKRQGYTDAEIGTHAGLADTALAQAVDPKLVRSDKLALPPSAAMGSYGDPRRATAELGRAGVDMIVARTVEAIRKAVTRP